MIHGLYLETTMKKSALTQLSMTLALFISAIHFVLFWGQQYGTFFSSLRGVLFFIALPLVVAFIPIKNKPIMTLGGILFYIPLLIFCYYEQYIATYTGGGAGMIYITTLIFGIPLIITGMFVVPFVLRFFGIEMIDDE